MGKMIRIKADSKKAQVLLEAAADGRIDVLATTSDTDLRAARCRSGCTVLHWAAGSNQSSAIDYLTVERKWDANNTIVEQRQGHGRTPLHYACRNGCLEAVRCLIEKHNACPNVQTTKDKVTPFQLAVWRNQFRVCQYLVNECNVDPKQVNEFGCNALHWLAICPVERATTDTAGGSRDDNNGNSSNNNIISSTTHHHHHTSTGSVLIPMADWLIHECHVDVNARQNQNHSVLMKAAWLGHFDLVKYLHEQHDQWDDTNDHAGNYAVDLVRMTGSKQLSKRHEAVLDYLLHHCSRDRIESCKVLQLPLEDSNNERAIRQAYYRIVRNVHPDNNAVVSSGLTEDDNNINTTISDEFHKVQRAYQHLLSGGKGSQKNPAHSLNLMLQFSGGGESSSNNKAKENRETNTAVAATGPSRGLNDMAGNDDDDDCFKARLLAVLFEYGDKGLNLSQVSKKWAQVWPDIPFPYNNCQNQTTDSTAEGGYNNNNKGQRRPRLSHWIKERAGDTVRIVKDKQGALRVHAKHCTKAQVMEAAAASGTADNTDPSST